MGLQLGYCRRHHSVSVFTTYLLNDLCVLFRYYKEPLTYTRNAWPTSTEKAILAGPNFQSSMFLFSY